MNDDTGEEPGNETPEGAVTDGPRITVFVGMASGSPETYELDAEEVPVGWHRMTDEQKSEAMQPIVQLYMDNVVQAGWGEVE
ncbi:hypothetical protein ACFUJY_29470 [Streptomyces sp. NPDC057249]|uniref:hypothetical protein n=1 Tax=Streptomyces sp. NPDC057249 TaxID=3346067 RepID=UPI00363FB435